MTLDEALYYIHSVCWKGSIPGLERISALLEKMGNPERTLKFVHVTGTNGKGSTCAMLASMLQKAGYKTGLYTSPYIEKFNERIQINGEMIPDEEICELTEYIKPLADSIFEQPTEFEMVTALGFAYFAKHKCDIVVAEVGMGGEFDATNVILPPEAAVICNIGLDHTEVLGETLEKIAATKAGIIKEGCEAVLYRAEPSVEAVFERHCANLSVPLHKADFDAIVPVSHDLDGQVFSFGRFENLHLPLLGTHQLHNAAVALTAADVLQKRGWALTDEHIRTGLAEVSWPGRFELLRREPLFIADGGHNPQCIEALVENIRKYLAGRSLTVLTGVLADKDYNSMYCDVAPFVREFVTITPDNPRAMSAEDLAKYLSQFGKPVTACATAKEGVHTAIGLAGSDGVVLCYGSLYMLGDIKAAVKEEEKTL
ncbi:MAG: bifunctional folylpolyglutamate synthase/dihydrofolate synthase [Oscillospiraceae bacterium]|nr:bifunctional folylpolyglutamate synthase/dihydrofolate synthase [Oscillospiraceae bacterium]